MSCHLQYGAVQWAVTVQCRTAGNDLPWSGLCNVVTVVATLTHIYIYNKNVNYLVSQTLVSLHISMHIWVTRLTPHIHEHIGQSDQCTFTYTHQVHVNMQWAVWLTCSCKCAESQKIRSLHTFMHISDMGPTAQLQEHIRQSDHRTFTSTHQVHVNEQWTEWLTCACKCAESQTIGSLHIFMHTSVIGLTA